MLLGASILHPAIPQSAGVHALTAGAMAGMILAVMSRASLGHTGRALEADAITQMTFALITAAAVARVAAPLLLEQYTGLMRASALLWIGAFGLFLLKFGLILFKPRVGEAR
jgi:uncharacterized protein involved in response to NO